MKVTQTTRPGEAYIRLSNIIKKMQVGDKIPPYSKLLKELAITQRSLDMAYDRLKEEGVLEVRKHRGVFVRRPYEGGIFLFVAAADIFLTHHNGEGLRLYFDELRKVVQKKFLGSKLEILLTESPDTEDYDREPQLRQRIKAMSNQYRLLGVFTSYKICEQKTRDLFKNKKLPFIDINGDFLKIFDDFYSMKKMVKYLQEKGFKDIIIAGIDSYIDKHFSANWMEHAKELTDYLSVTPDIRCLTVPVNQIQEHNIIQCGIDWIAKLIDEKKLPEAFVVLDDYFCTGILMGAYMKNIFLEDQYKIITVANKGCSIYSKEPQKIIRLNCCWDKIADVASELMFKFIREEPVQYPVFVEPVLID